MANIKSQLKRIKTNEKSRQRNKATKSALKTIDPSVPRGRGRCWRDRQGHRAGVRRLPRASTRLHPRAIIHKNQAANRKSAIAAKAASGELPARS